MLVRLILVSWLEPVAVRPSRRANVFVPFDLTSGGDTRLMDVRRFVVNNDSQADVTTHDGERFKVWDEAEIKRVEAELRATMRYNCLL